MTALTRCIEIVKAHREIVFWALIGISLDIGYFSLKDTPLIADEGYHLPQIGEFVAGRYEVAETITVLPFYHALMATVLILAGAETVSDARLVNFLGSATSVWVYYTIVARLWPEQRFLRTAQFVFLPILFPMHFVIYTDTWALGFVLLAVQRALCGAAWQSATAIACATLMRQPNLVWGALAWIILIWSADGIRPTWERLRSNWHKHTLPFAIVFAGFGLFFLANGGVAVGDKSHHHIGINFANIWFFSLCFFIFFWPSCIGTALRSRKHLARNLKTSSVAFFGLFALFASTYHAAHPYNRPSLWFYLRNRVLEWTSGTFVAKVSSAIPVALGVTGFLFTPLKERKFYFLIPVTLSSILIMPLIEQRYYLVAMSLFSAFRHSEDIRFEWANLIWYGAASFSLMIGIANHWYFI